VKYKKSLFPSKKITEGNIEKTCVDLGLNLTLQAALSSLPENTHWHFKQGKRKGVLEITQLKGSGELIFEIHQNRNGGWEKDTIQLILSRFAV